MRYKLLLAGNQDPDPMAQSCIVGKTGSKSIPGCVKGIQTYNCCSLGAWTVEIVLNFDFVHVLLFDVDTFSNKIHERNPYKYQYTSYAKLEGCTVIIFLLNVQTFKEYYMVPIYQITSRLDPSYRFFIFTITKNFPFLTFEIYVCFF